MPKEREAKVKGAAVQDFYAWYARQFGQTRMAQIWAELPEDVKREVGPSHSNLLPFHWYSARAVHALMDATLKGHSNEERESLAREGAHVVIGQTLRGLYRAIFKTLVSPERYLRSLNTIWGSFHDTGRVEGQVLGPGHHRTELRGWRGHHAFIERLNGYAAKEIYEAMGCAGVTFEQSHGVDDAGQRTYVTDIRWRP